MPNELSKEISDDDQLRRLSSTYRGAEMLELFGSMIIEFDNIPLLNKLFSKCAEIHYPLSTRGMTGSDFEVLFQIIKSLKF